VAFYPLYCPLFPLRTSVFSMIFYLLWSLLLLLRPSAPSMALSLLYSPLSPLPDTFLLSLFREMMTLFSYLAKHVLWKRAISWNSETSKTTPLVSRNSETRFAKILQSAFRQKP
jgi:hypothetical protein